VTAPVGTTAIIIGQAVVASELPGSEEHPGSGLHVGVRGEGDRASDEQRRFRLQEV
jgi:hypothetical protein